MAAKKKKTYDCAKCDNRDDFFKCRYEDEIKCDYFKPIPESDVHAD